MTSNKSVTVFGAYGHTGRFVVSEYAGADGRRSSPDEIPTS